MCQDAIIEGFWIFQDSEYVSQVSAYFDNLNGKFNPNMDKIRALLSKM